MALNLAKYFNLVKTPQSQKIPGTAQIANSAGGFSFAVDAWARLDRFLVLGSEGGSYYATERALTIENAEAVADCIAKDGVRVVRRIVEISDAGRAPKNDPAIFALAMCAKLGDPATRKAALDAVPKVCRIGTHLFHFARDVQAFGGWGRGTRRAIASWYVDAPVEKLALQVVKYQSRDGWAHRDLLRLAHPKTYDVAKNALFGWIVKGELGAAGDVDALALVRAFQRAKVTTDKAELITLITQHGLPREAVPTQWLDDADVWAALLADMPMTAMIRNLATMTRVGLVTHLGAATKTVVDRLRDRTALRKARVHPIQVLSALMTYQAGHGAKGKHTWTPVSQVVDALDAAFYASFANVVPTNKRWMLALDVSGSMAGGEVAGVPGLTPRVASAAMALVTAATEPNHVFTAFTSAGWASKRSQTPYGGGISKLDLSPRMRLDDVLRATNGLPFGGTDCALPMLYAKEKKLDVDVFVVLTDSETWAGGVHPVQALREYREARGIAAKLIVVGMVANAFTIADPNDAGMLDVVGFDTNVPSIMADFARE
ncbi:TROVE domain-containing protein [Myxococcota bacterium]|nr:TROVE domain-containing protein [Myxococcota bacterium]